MHGQCVGHARCVGSGGAHAVAAARGASGWARAVRYEQPRINLAQEATQLMPHGVQLKLGDHPRASQIRDLDLGIAIQYVYVPECQMILSLPETT